MHMVHNAHAQWAAHLIELDQTNNKNNINDGNLITCYLLVVCMCNC